MQILQKDAEKGESEAEESYGTDIDVSHVELSNKDLTTLLEGHYKQIR